MIILKQMVGSLPLEIFTNAVARVAEAIAGMIVALAVIEALIRGFPAFFRRGDQTSGHKGTEQVRLRLGRWLTLALEALVAADILRTAVAPSWTDIGQLAAIIALRTALNFFLQKEIDKASQPQRPYDMPKAAA